VSCRPQQPRKAFQGPGKSLHRRRGAGIPACPTGALQFYQKEEADRDEPPANVSETSVKNPGPESLCRNAKKLQFTSVMPGSIRHPEFYLTEITLDPGSSPG